MADSIYSISEIVGASTSSIEDAIGSALSRARSTLRNVHWFEVESVRGAVDEDGSVTYQVTVKVGFRLEDH